MPRTRSMADILRDVNFHIQERILQGDHLARHVEHQHHHTPPAVRTNPPSIQQPNPTLPAVHFTPSSVQQPTSTIPAVLITSPVVLQPIVVPAIVQRLSFSPTPVQPSATPPVHPNTTPIQPSTTPPIQSNTTPPGYPNTTPPIQPHTTPSIHPNTTPPIQPSTTLPVYPNTTTPIQRHTTPPIHPNTTPIQPSTTPPVYPNTTPPFWPNTTPPVYPNTTPVYPNTTPVYPNTTPPIHPSTTPPIHPNTTPPVHPNNTPIHPSITLPVHPNNTPSIQPSTTLPAQATYSLPLVQSTPLGQPSTDTHPSLQGMPTQGFSMEQGSSSCIQEADSDIDEAYDSMEEDGTGAEDVPAEEPLQYDNAGRVIIVPCGTSWIPKDKLVGAIGHVIKSHFEGPYHLYEAVPEDMKEKWWTEFMKIITWAPHHECKIREVYNRQVKRCLRDMVNKVRQKGTKPHWIGEAAWSGLLTYWESKEFKDNSARNKANQASAQGGALHTTGRMSHHEMALRLTHELSRPVIPDELLVATHRKKDGGWVDDRSLNTYAQYQECLRQEVDKATKIQYWKDAAEGKTRGRCYGTGHLACNVRPGVSSLTQESRFGPSSSRGFQYSGETEALRREIQRVTEQADAATVQAKAAATALAEANQKYAHMEQQLKLVQEQLQMVLDRRSGGASTGTSQVHPHEAEDQDDPPLDEEGAPPRQRRRY